MASDDYLDHTKKDKILEQHGTTILKRTNVDPISMSEFVAVQVLDAYQSKDIQEQRTTSEKRNALLAHLQDGTIKQFIDYCLVMVDKQKRTDIVVDEFRLNISQLRQQKAQILKKEEEAEMEREKERQPTSVPSTTEGSTTDSPMSPRQSAPQDEGDNMISHDEVMSRTKTQSTQQLAVAAKGGNAMDTSDGGFGLGLLCTRALQAPVAPANTVQSTFKKDMWKRLKIMNDELKNNINPPRVVIAVLDTGMYRDHPRLKDHIIGWKSVIDGEDGDLHVDQANHGTISAGVIVEFAGRCVDIINIKVNNENSSLDALHAGFKSIDDWEKQNPEFKVDIVVTSINASEIEPGLQDDFDTTLFKLAKNTVIICAAANHGATYNDTVCYPASCPSALAIGSVDRFGNRSGFSSQGHALDFMFQGEGFVSTSRPPQNEEERKLIYQPTSIPNDWLTNSARGTSFAAPQCAAAVANILSYTELTLGAEYRKRLTRTDVIRKLLIPVCPHEHDNKTGYGFPRLDMLKREYIKDHVNQMYPS